MIVSALFNLKLNRLEKSLWLLNLMDKTKLCITEASRLNKMSHLKTLVQKSQLTPEHRVNAFAKL